MPHEGGESERLRKQKCKNHRKNPCKVTSAQTFVMKAIFPVVWIAGFGAGTLMVWRARLQTAAQSLPPPEWKWLFLGGFVCGGAFIVRTCVPLKRVRLTQDTLLISNYWREIR